MQVSLTPSPHWKRVPSTFKKLDLGRLYYGQRSRTVARESQSEASIKKVRNRVKLPILSPLKCPVSIRTFHVTWKRLDYNEGRPEAREGASMKTCGGVMFLYGGLSKSVLSDVYYKTAPYTPWEKAKFTTYDSDVSYGHTMVEYQRKLITFGGAGNCNPRAQIRECINTVKQLANTEGRFHWKALSARGHVIEMRRYHTATVVGDDLVVIGGMNQKNKVLEDCVVMNFKRFEWVTMNFINEPFSVACHAAALITEPEANITGLLDPELKKDPTSGPVRKRGLYVFGGGDYKGQCNNEMRIIKPHRDKVQWTTLETSGKPPPPRRQHSMVLCRSRNILIIFGGRCDGPNDENHASFNDLHILDLEFLCWSRLHINGVIPSPRCAHCAEMMSGSMVLFGGIDGSQFCRSETYMLEIEAKEASSTSLIESIQVRKESVEKAVVANEMVMPRLRTHRIRRLVDL